jgi:hypothetical protein
MSKPSHRSNTDHYTRIAHSAHALMLLLLGCTPPVGAVVHDAGTDDGTSTATSTSYDTMAPTSVDGSDGTNESEGVDGHDGAGETMGEPPEGACTDFAGHVVYINFDGPTLTHGFDDARANVTELADLAIELEPFGGSNSHKSEIVRRVEELYEDFDVCVTDTRPATGDYTMAVVTPTNPFAGGYHGIAGQVDCLNANPNNIIFAFGSWQSPGTTVIGTVVAKGLGHSYGLHTSAAASDVMAYFPGSTSTFKDICFTLDGGWFCAHEICDSGEQNSWRKLREILGPRRR